MANTDFKMAKFGSCQFTDCRLLGADFTQTTLIATTFKNCPAQMINFSEAYFQKCQFQTCDFTDALFLNVTTRLRTKVQFDDCQLQRVDLLDTKLKGWDVSRSTLGEWHLSAQDIGGLVIAPWQAANLISLFGVQVKA
ncbi:hypothetical protein FC07_GL001403 [Loigolactobacillus bifermentans DSM 20003]|uniref:Pentapeptide repeat-containing protein n=2 Tax=Loigolactobacillus bifermentans TaxID=1607 RepID=A0A0R1GFZ4_9LACO|nr:hypothetical protein FC07_GL001403 [Loigolactobacillus bifermentans DSM 20003]